MSNPNPHPKSDGLGGENPNPTDSDFLYIRHIPSCGTDLRLEAHICTAHPALETEVPESAERVASGGAYGLRCR
jgi:hypothetical protein